MQTQKSLNINDARDLGVAAAVAHADRVHASWSDLAYEILYYCAERYAYLTSESVRQYADNERNLAAPPDKRAWGAIMLRGARSGLLTKEGWTTAKDPKVHCNPISSWKSNIFDKWNPV